MAALRISFLLRCKLVVATRHRGIDVLYLVEQLILAFLLGGTLSRPRVSPTAWLLAMSWTGGLSRCIAVRLVRLAVSLVAMSIVFFRVLVLPVGVAFRWHSCERLLVKSSGHACGWGFRCWLSPARWSAVCLGRFGSHALSLAHWWVLCEFLATRNHSVLLASQWLGRARDHTKWARLNCVRCRWRLIGMRNR